LSFLSYNMIECFAFLFSVLSYNVIECLHFSSVS
jgi:hypothetical protein